MRQIEQKQINVTDGRTDMLISYLDNLKPGVT